MTPPRTPPPQVPNFDTGLFCVSAGVLMACFDCERGVMSPLLVKLFGNFFPELFPAQIVRDGAANRGEMAMVAAPKEAHVFIRRNLSLASLRGGKVAGGGTTGNKGGAGGGGGAGGKRSSTV
jgi:hypothetical protein